ncbi:unnamed protein product, partial [Effrenium voratum]
VTHGFMQAMTPQHPFGERTASAASRPSSAGRIVTLPGQQPPKVSPEAGGTGGYAIRRPSVATYAGYEDRARRTSCSNVGDVMAPKSVNSLRAQVNGIRSSAVVADADAICRARGRRPSVVEVHSFGSTGPLMG